MNPTALRVQMAIRDMNASELARRVEVNPATAWRWVHGKYPMPPQQAEKVIAALFEPAGAQAVPEK